MSLYDFYMYLKYIEFSSENLEFYIWFKNYEESYNKGLASRYDKDEVLVKTASESGSVSSSVFKKSHYHLSDGEGDGDSEKAAGDTLHRISMLIAVSAPCAASIAHPSCHPGGPCAPSSNLAFPTTTFFHNFNNSRTAVLPSDPTPDPSHPANKSGTLGLLAPQPGPIPPSEIQTIINLFLLPSSPKELNIPMSLRRAALDALAATPQGTLPDPKILRPIADHVYHLLHSCSHRNFVRLGVSNGTFETICFATFLGFVSLALGFLVVLVRAFTEGRGARSRWESFAGFGFWVVGMSLVLSGLRGSCFFLLLFSRRQRLPWERLNDGEKAGSREDLEINGGQEENEEGNETKRRSVRQRVGRMMIFDKRLKVQERSLRRLQRKIVMQSMVGGTIFAALSSVVFMFLPIWKETVCDD
ncbi:unnamed protein product [Sordaria macrospora k-hell]|uniref:WGS project CABT00000000 data, contig 2.30 n=2 Tax=Sordaria macrospora TaxID=5147 RepID=F7W5C6_SORMK|nr:uncharacterized protein SMAC_05674 [Sordaria macrospora k-hell]KAH7628075.1 hypothetical protein B0T09DRAFT_268473 [Sordaria sp. MPI-SDFR-AT-0083]CCC12714.1 unnamed protein product [Sordaria macrospora k-hell]